MVAQSIAPSIDEVLVFDRYQLDIRRRVLLENGRHVKLGSRGLSILIVLAQRAGQTVSKRELVSLIWPDAFVVDGTLRVHISALQRALGKSEWGGRFVENISGQGYRLTEPVVQGRRSRTAALPADPPRQPLRAGDSRV
jgi:DNA-binding winged helix-turn-helix (wHTH) protein